ncbi:hypothetical protein KZ813_13565 [Sphingomonas sp. RHCKR7]|uniref:hypothetical protein n=1 Tax=Sphingomonas folli TaxID=2862497 RepID=UPI001CA548A6|nr:hypothetical protein [Sphingomonas folli]MBW6527869.1 hypothetical protein [Sphingomonas folli]
MADRIKRWEKVIDTPSLAFLLLAPVLLGSCSRAIKLLIENKSFDDVRAVVRRGPNGESQWIRPERARWMGWPSPDHHILIEKRHCARTFDLDEGFDPAETWQDENGWLSQRYFVDEAGDLNVLGPDAAHRTLWHSPTSPSPRFRKLTRLSQRCGNDQATRPSESEQGD